MLLHTPAYLLFLGVVALLYWSLRQRRGRIYILLMASYIFYAAFDIRFAGILLVLTAATYLIGRAIHARPHAHGYLWLGCALNLAVLGLLKYANFFLDSIRAGLSVFGVSEPLPALNVLLPIGISFYSFQAISYLVEVSQQKVDPIPGFATFALYLAFFPKLIAGPLIRPADFLKQIKEPATSLTPDELRRALSLLVMGLVKKIVIADSLASLADVAYRAAALPSSSAFPTLLYWQGFYLFAFQIYADFSGYTDIACASARLLGFALPANFDRPYFAVTPGDFWNRWHMSLTQWFRETLFFPLSRMLLRRTQQRYSRAVQVVSNLVTMTLIGLWHGAAWTFVVWGLWHGVLLSIERLAAPRLTRRWHKAIAAILTFHLVAVGWVLFRADSFQDASRFLAGLLTFQQEVWWPMYVPSMVITAALTFGLDLLKIESRPSWRPIVLTAGLVLIVALTILNIARGYEARPFIYGRF